jgi:hypothetical protein
MEKGCSTWEYIHQGTELKYKDETSEALNCMEVKFGHFVRLFWNGLKCGGGEWWTRLACLMVWQGRSVTES